MKTDFDAIVVGAGFSGLYMLHRLREQGLNVRVFERGTAVGGTWYWNRYPGLQCDTETISYSFTFDADLYRDWTWSRRFAPREEIQRYAEYVTDRLDLRRDIQFQTSVTFAHFQEDTNTWKVGLDDGTELTTRFFVTASGPLSTANVPQLPGMENFEGEVYHTATWPREDVQFTGKRIAVIGTGSSGAQVICNGGIAEQVGRMVVFQRTPQYITPAKQMLLDEETVRERKDNLEALVEEMKNSSFGAPGTSTDRSAFEHTPKQRDEVFQAAWEYGAQAFALATYNDLTSNEEANGFAADFVRRKIAEIVSDPETARKLMPNYLFGTKRPIKADNYYETFNRDNVDLVALKEEPIQEVTANGIRTSDGFYELDMIIFATGFDAVTGTLFNMDIRGVGGQTLQEKWLDGAEVMAHLGIATHGFPNMFMCQGPQSPSVMANFLFGIELNVGWTAKLIGYLVAHGIERAEANADAEFEWADMVQQQAEATLLLKTESWWSGANIAEKPRPKFFLTYLGGVKKYREELDANEANGFKGFTLSSALEPAVAQA
ncbi:NAD(P)/FAD-dependent oxidoreductase [Arthrobacter methylotrophus]|uniref:Flavin-containing monooxygenase n=1 Tax=Arthrobacter methylotrophus TaxID=121291 RepID=A0ABV5UJP7_9MICC